MSGSRRESSTLTDLIWLTPRYHLLNEASSICWVGRVVLETVPVRWASQMIAVRGIEGVRVLQGFLSLARKYPANIINQAGDKALEAACFRLRPVRQLCQRYAEDQQELSLDEKHPIIRPLSEYQNLMTTIKNKQETQT